MEQCSDGMVLVEIREAMMGIDGYLGTYLCDNVMLCYVVLCYAMLCSAVLG